MEVLWYKFREIHYLSLYALEQFFSPVTVEIPPFTSDLSSHMFLCSIAGCVKTKKFIMGYGLGIDTLVPRYLTQQGDLTHSFVQGFLGSYIF